MRHGGQTEDALKALVSLLDSGGASSIFATGSADEFIATIMLVMAYDHALVRLLATSPQSTYAEAPVSVGDHLQGLVGRTTFAALKRESCGMLLDSFVSILQTVTIVDKVSRGRLLAFFEQRCAVVCRPGEYAIDMVVPIVLSGPEGKRAQSLTPDDMTGMFIQVKSWQKSDLSTERIEQVLSKIDDAARDVIPGAEYIAMLISVNEGAIRGEVRTLCQYRDGRMQIVISGVSHQRSLSSEQASIAQSCHALLSTTAASQSGAHADGSSRADAALPTSVVACSTVAGGLYDGL